MGQIWTQIKSTTIQGPKEFTSDLFVYFFSYQTLQPCVLECARASTHTSVKLIPH